MSAEAKLADRGPVYPWELAELSDSELEQWEAMLINALRPLKARLKRVKREQARRQRSKTLPLIAMFEASDNRAKGDPIA